ncbi:DinB family protein [Jeotgalibacillus proteolyticus]|uniref:Damage-inducible protein DinB n=1 Tax=Jeotgalibacillus proteolyticus TaxID=2082395 RepID=A0A2S5GDM6_9BACL|nr:DinB family protein [Jeotgalibacillus proteolyticus]PPA71058.1 hypothetical protein C4B60_09795 [Jeotgalibacillus proteolyticus]
MLKELFYYNWQVREDWFKWCEELSSEELTKKRTGGMGSIIDTLFHVIDCEQLWINQLKGNPVVNKDKRSMVTINDLKQYAVETGSSTTGYFDDNRIVADGPLVIKNKMGKEFVFSHEKVLYHIITHEIHHIGQLSIWAREVKKVPVNTDLLMRDFYKKLT